MKQFVIEPRDSRTEETVYVSMKNTRPVVIDRVTHFSVEEEKGGGERRKKEVRRGGEEEEEEG